MNMLDKFKDKLQNLDINTISTSIVSTFGAASTEDLLQAIFTTIMILSSLWSLMLSKKKESIDTARGMIQNDKELVELEFRKAELKRYELETNKMNELTLKVEFNENLNNETDK